MLIFSSFASLVRRKFNFLFSSNKHKVYVINLDWDLQRKKTVTRSLSFLNLKFDFVRAVDGGFPLTLNALFACDVPGRQRIYSSRKKPITSKELACTLSHVRAIKLALAEGAEGAWIVEDDVDFLENDFKFLEKIVSRAPANASYLQFQVSPMVTLRALSKRFTSENSLFEVKKVFPPVEFESPDMSGFTAHGAGAYFVTRVGLKNFASHLLSDGKVIFPCNYEDCSSNKWLIADKFIYWALSEAGAPGYAIRLPFMTTSAQNSRIHPDHVEGHYKARQAAIAIFRASSLKKFKG